MDASPHHPQQQTFGTSPGSPNIQFAMSDMGSKLVIVKGIQLVNDIAESTEKTADDTDPTHNKRETITEIGVTPIDNSQNNTDPAFIRPFLTKDLQDRFMLVKCREEAYDKLDYLSHFGRIDLVRELLSSEFTWKPSKKEMQLFQEVVKQLEINPKTIMKIWAVTFINDLNMEQYRVMIITVEGYYRVNTGECDGNGRFKYIMFPIKSLKEVIFGKLYNTNKKWTIRHLLENSRYERNYVGVMIKTIHGEVNKFYLWYEDRLGKLYNDIPHVIGEYFVKEIVCAFRCVIAYKSKDDTDQFVVPIYESVIPRRSKYIFITMKSMEKDKKSESN